MPELLRNNENGGDARAASTVLPFGDTLHYTSCGCPPDWHNTTRAADVVDILVQKAFQAYQEGRLAATRPLRVLYFLPHHNVTGGMKCLVEHVRLLKLRGKPTCLYCHFPPGHLALIGSPWGTAARYLRCYRTACPSKRCPVAMSV